MLLEKDLKKLCLEVAYPVVSTIDGENLNTRKRATAGHACYLIHATRWPGSFSIKGISPLLHSSDACGHLDAKRQPGFGSIGLVTSPLMISFILSSGLMLGLGIAASNAAV